MASESEIGYIKITLSSDDRNSAAELIPGEGDKTGEWAGSKNMIPIYAIAMDLSAQVDGSTSEVTSPIQQKNVKIRKKLGNASPLLFQAFTHRRGIHSVEIFLMKSSGGDAEKVALNIVGSRGVFARFATVTDTVSGLHGVTSNRHDKSVQYEEIELACTKWDLTNIKLIDYEKSTLGMYDFRNPNAKK